MKEYTFIVNPEAGRGHARKILEPLQNELIGRNIDFELLVTTRAGQAMELARHCTGSTVVSVGGDGTLNEIVNGISRDYRAIGIIPAGSGNDFIKSINVPRRLTAALDIILAGKIRKVDAGVITCTGPAQGNAATETHERIFINGVGVGFDAAVAARMRAIKRLRGTAVYVLAVLQTLGKYKAPVFRLTIDKVEQSARNLLIAIGNGRCAGGGFYLTPDAVVDDGQLDLCVIEDVSVSKILRLMPLVMMGKHRKIKEVSLLKAKEQILVDSEQGFFVHADGEVVGESVTHVDITIRRSHVPVLTG